MPFAVKFLQGLQVDGTWNVPTALTFVGCVDKGFNGGLNFTRSTRFSSRPWPPRSYQRPPRDYQLRIDLDT